MSVLPPQHPHPLPPLAARIRALGEPLAHQLKARTEKPVQLRDRLEKAIARLPANYRLLIAAHGNSLRALIKYLDGVSDEAIVELNVPTGVPLVYTLDERLKPLGRRYLGDPAAVAKAAEAVAKQGQAKR